MIDVVPAARDLEHVAPRFDDELANAQTLSVRLTDIAVALAVFALSLAALAAGINGVPLPVATSLYAAALAFALLYLIMRLCARGELTIAAILVMATIVSGPIGALGTACMALALWCRRLAPRRLQQWYDYISGIVERPKATRIYDEIASGRLPADPAARVPRLAPILAGSAIDDQQRVLGVIGRRYHSDFRSVLKRALRDRNGLVRAQAAAIASRLDLEEKNHLWASDPVPEIDALADTVAGQSETQHGT